LNLEAIGDFNQGNLEWAEFVVVNEYFGDESFIDSEMAMFWLKHKDPTLTRLMMGNRFHCSHPTESDGFFNSSSHYKRAVMDVLDAVDSYPYLTKQILAVDDLNSILWTEGNAWNGLISVLRDKPSTTALLIRTLLTHLAMVGEMLQHCPQLKILITFYDGCKMAGYGMGDLVKSLNKLPVLESVQFYTVPLCPRDGIILYPMLMKKNLVRSILMCTPNLIIGLHPT
jgi:hypothetical protein